VYVAGCPTAVCDNEGLYNLFSVLFRLFYRPLNHTAARVLVMTS
jgi:hypothetical protein